MLLSALSAGCGPSYEIAMITYASAPQDDAYSAEVWRGIQEYAAENARAARYYTAQEQTVAACLAAVKKAVDGGARVVIFPGCVFEQALLSAQSEYTRRQFHHH